MPAQRMQPTSAKQLAIELLGLADRPVRAKELARQIIESGRCSGLKGKTPEATISAMLAVGAKPGGPFKRVDKGTYTLAAAAEGEEPKATSVAKASPGKRTAAAKPSRARSAAKATTAKRGTAARSTSGRAKRAR